MNHAHFPPQSWDPNEMGDQPYLSTHQPTAVPFFFVHMQSSPDFGIPSDTNTELLQPVYPPPQPAFSYNVSIADPSYGAPINTSPYIGGGVDIQEPVAEHTVPVGVNAQSALAGESPGPSVSRRRGHSVVYECLVCRKTYPKPSRLASHSLVHTGEKRHICTVETCRKAFPTVSNLNRHLRSIHGLDPPSKAARQSTVPHRSPHNQSLAGEY